MSLHWNLRLLGDWKALAVILLYDCYSVTLKSPLTRRLKDKERAVLVNRKIYVTLKSPLTRRLKGYARSISFSSTCPLQWNLHLLGDWKSNSNLRFLAFSLVTMKSPFTRRLKDDTYRIDEKTAAQLQWNLHLLGDWKLQVSLRRVVLQYPLQWNLHLLGDWKALAASAGGVVKVVTMKSPFTRRLKASMAKDNCLPSLCYNEISIY